MATVNKDFRVKNGLVVEGSTATVNGSAVLTESSTEFLQDTTAAMFDGPQSGIAFEYNDTTGKITATVSTTPTFADKITFEGATPDSYETILQVTEPTQDNTITLPNSTTTLVGTDTTNTLTNKTFDTAGTGNVLQINGNTVNSYTGSGSTVVLSTSPSISTGINFNGGVSGQTTLSADGVASGTLTLPAATDTLVGKATTDTLTNKTISGNSNTLSDIGNASLVNDSVTINGYEITLGSSATYSTDNINEGTTNKYFTDERAQDAIGILIANGTQTNISVTYDDSTAALNFNATGGVASLSGTANEVEVTNVGTAYTVGLPSDITVAGNITINGTPTQSTHAVTKGYVDSVAEGLNVHPSSKAATTANIDLSTGGLLVIDGYQTIAGDRILVKSQTNAAQNGIYVVASGAWTRAADFDTPTEVVPGDFTFVENGTSYGDTGWVQTNTVTTIGTDPISFTQFSGAGTYLAGNGLTLTGSTFTIDTTVTADLNSVQTLTNKTLTSPTLTTPSISGMLVLDNNIVIEGTDDTHETTLTFTDPTQDNVITFKNATGTLAFTSDITSAIDALTTTDIEEGTNLYYTNERVDDRVAAITVGGTGISVTYVDEPIPSLTVANTGVISITGTTNQITASASSGDITLSLPQNINTTSSPSFAALSVGSGSVTAGSITLADALLGSAAASLTDSNATVIDTWSASTYNSAKYIVQLKSGTDIEVLEVLVAVDGNNNVYLTEYADVQSNIQLGTTDADYSGGNVRLLVTASNGTTVKVHKTLIEA